MPSGHGKIAKKASSFGWLTSRENPSPKKREKGAPLGTTGQLGSAQSLDFPDSKAGQFTSDVPFLGASERENGGNHADHSNDTRLENGPRKPYALIGKAQSGKIGLPGSISGGTTPKDPLSCAAGA